MYMTLSGWTIHESIPTRYLRDPKTSEAYTDSNGTPLNKVWENTLAGIFDRLEIEHYYDPHHFAYHLLDYALDGYAYDFEDNTDRKDEDEESARDRWVSDVSNYNPFEGAPEWIDNGVWPAFRESIAQLAYDIYVSRV
jgi:hypothetical protein